MDKIKMPDKQLEILILKFLDGSVSDEETALLKDWLRNPKHRKTFEAYVKRHFELQLLLQDVDTVKDYGKVIDAISKKRASRKKSVSTNFFRYAAIFVGLVTVSIILYYQGSFSKDSPIGGNQITLQLQDGSIKVLDQEASGNITNAKGEKVVAQQQNLLRYTDSLQQVVGKGQEIAYNELTVPYGKKFQIQLSDGTHVFLNSGSKIKYPVRFLSSGNREVFLDGEAYFEVTKNEGNPFVVNTQELNTVVLGTKFNVSSYKNEYNTSTVLVEGAVRVEGNDKAARIKPGERAMIENGKISVDNVNVEKHIAWTKGQLYFVDDSFALILKELERHFDVKIQNNNEALNQIPFTGTFETESLEAILTSFQLHSDFTYSVTEKGNSILIIP